MVVELKPLLSEVEEAVEQVFVVVPQEGCHAIRASHAVRAGFVDIVFIKIDDVWEAMTTVCRHGRALVRVVRRNGVRGKFLQELIHGGLIGYGDDGRVGSSEGMGVWPGDCLEEVICLTLGALSSIMPA